MRGVEERLKGVSFADTVDSICRGVDVSPETMRRNKNDIKDFDDTVC